MRPQPAAAPWPWPASSATRPARSMPRRAWSSAPCMTATWTRPCSWPGKVCRSRTSPAQTSGATATCWPGALAAAGDLAAAEQACAATLAQARDAGDMIVLGDLLRIMAELDLRVGRTGDAVTVWAAWDTFSQQRGLPVSDADMRRHEDAQRNAREMLGPDRARAAE